MTRASLAKILTTALLVSVAMSASAQTNPLWTQEKVSNYLPHMSTADVADFLTRSDMVLIPIRMGAGLRLGVNAGYLRFSKKQRWLPF